MATIQQRIPAVDESGTQETLRRSEGMLYWKLGFQRPDASIVAISAVLGAPGSGAPRESEPGYDNAESKENREGPRRIAWRRDAPTIAPCGWGTSSNGPLYAHVALHL